MMSTTAAVTVALVTCDVLACLIVYIPVKYATVLLTAHYKMMKNTARHVP
jgi:hypothetical protein